MKNSPAALLVIDMQLGLVTGAHAENETLRNVNAVIRKARSASAAVAFIQHNHASFEPLMKGGNGWHIHPALEVEDHDIFIEKEASDAFYQTDLEARLKALDVSTVVVTGMQTEYCVDATCRSALSKDLDVVLVTNGHTTGPSHLSAAEIIEHHNIILANLAHPTAVLRAISAADVSFERRPDDGRS